MINSLQYFFYLVDFVLGRLTPLRASLFAENTLNRYTSEYFASPEFGADQRLPKSQSKYWRLSRAVECERIYRERINGIRERGFFFVWRKTTIRMVFLILAFLALREALPHYLHSFSQSAGIHSIPTQSR